MYDRHIPYRICDLDVDEHVEIYGQPAVASYLSLEHYTESSKATLMCQAFSSEIQNIENTKRKQRPVDRCNFENGVQLILICFSGEDLW